MPDRILRGNGLGQWPAGRRNQQQPIVARANEQTAKRLGITLDQLLEVAATLERWGSHADGSDVFRFRDLLAALGRQPEPTRTAAHRGGQATRRRIAAAKGA